MWTLLSDPAIVSDRWRSRSLTIAGIEQGSTPAIVGDSAIVQRSSAIIWEHFSAIERSCAMATVCCCTCIQLFAQIWNMAACSMEEFMEEYRKYKCLYSIEYKDRYKKLNAWTKISEKFKITPDAVEAKLKNMWGQRPEDTAQTEKEHSVRFRNRFSSRASRVMYKPNKRAGNSLDSRSKTNANATPVFLFCFWHSLKNTNSFLQHCCPLIVPERRADSFVGIKFSCKQNRPRAVWKWY